MTIDDYNDVRSLINEAVKAAELPTLRDYFAAKAMQVLFEMDYTKSYEWIAIESYRMADALIAARTGDGHE